MKPLFFSGASVFCFPFTFISTGSLRLSVGLETPHLQ
jgi:hypothetical protein